jgi:hypothetical protein
MTVGFKALASTAVVAVVSVAVLAGRAEQPAGTGFEGSWSATGRRQTLPTENGETAATVQLSGPVTLSAGDGLSRGFQGELIGFDDGRSVPAGRWVWTDRRGDRVFGEIAGDRLGTGHLFKATITGGTGHYAGIAGRFTFTWKYVVSGEDGEIQGRTSDLKGEYQRGRP